MRHIVGKGNIKSDPMKTEKILNLTTPKTKKDVRKIGGLINYYRKCIPFFSHKIAPLASLLKKRKIQTTLFGMQTVKKPLQKLNKL